MQRETKEIQLSTGKKIIVKTYITGREANAIKEPMLARMKLGVDGDAISQRNEIDGTFMIEQERLLISNIVTSVDGQTENLLEYVLDLPLQEYKEIVVEINKIYNGNLAPVK